MDAVAGAPRRGVRTRLLPFFARGAAWWVGALLLLLFLAWTRVDIGGTWSSVHRRPLYLVDFLMLYVLVAIGLNLISGYVGAASIGHIALFAVGAYTAAILMTSHGWNYWPAIVAGGCMAAVVSLPTAMLSAIASGRIGVDGIAVGKAAASPPK